MCTQKHLACVSPQQQRRLSHKFYIYIFEAAMCCDAGLLLSLKYASMLRLYLVVGSPHHLLCFNPFTFIAKAAAVAVVPLDKLEYIIIESI